MKRFVVLGLVALMVLGSGCSKPRQPNEVISDANKALDAVENYSATLNIDVAMPTGGAESAPALVISKVSGINQNKLATDTEMTLPASGGANSIAQYKMVFDGENQWIEINDNITPKTVLKVALKDIVTFDKPFDACYLSYLNPPYPTCPTGLFEGYDLPSTIRTMLKLYDFKSVPAQKVDGVKCEVLEGELNNTEIADLRLDSPLSLANGININFARLYFDNATHFLRKYEVGADLKKPEFTAVVTDVTLNKDVTSALFTYTPPEGIQAKDLTLEVMKNKPRLAEKVKELEKQKPQAKPKEPTGKQPNEKEPSVPEVTAKTDTEAGVTPGKWGIRLIWYKNDKMGKHLANRMVAWLNANGVSNTFTRIERIGSVENISVYAGPYDTKDAAEKDMPGLQSKRSAFKDCDLIKFK